MRYTLIKECRKGRKMSQKELADRLEISQAAVCLYETGQRKLPVKLAIRLGGLFHLPWASFYEETDSEK